ncbi:DUF982 domain-containing protein [Rhizobium wenxiniae]|uniref:DUF982 domain-containing protein n=1 Tax=Rhizobium wenxiniae TaxID=1737357 RepID=UPI001C6E8482|nr:DUF982 domain-containing protein [Rhizobium wenxiniae]
MSITGWSQNPLYKHPQRRHHHFRPASFSNRAHAVALKACQAALRGEIEAETARGPFVAFAQKHDLVTVGTPAVVAARSHSDKDPHAQ